MKYKSVVAPKTRPPEVLEIVENELRPPAEKEVRIKVLAAAVCRPDISVRRGEALDSGTPLGQKVPFVPGYAVIGDVDALGPDVSGVTVGERVGVLAVTDGKSLKLYGTSFYFLFDKRPYLEDWAALFKLLQERKIEPVIMQKFPLLEAAKANQLRFLCAVQTLRPGPYAILPYKLTVPKRETTCSRLCRLCSGKNSSQ